MISRFYLWIYRVCIFVLFPIPFIHILSSYSASISEIVCVLIFIFIVIYFSYVKNKITYWLHFLFILFFWGWFINSMPNLMINHFVELSILLFDSFKSLSNFMSYFGMISLFISWYLWTGVSPLFGKYSVWKLDVKPKVKVDIVKMSLPNVFKNPIVVSVLILVLGAIIVIGYYRYSDPYNQCQRTFKKQYPNVDEMRIIQKCNQIIHGK